MSYNDNHDEIIVELSDAAADAEYSATAATAATAAPTATETPTEEPVADAVTHSYGLRRHIKPPDKLEYSVKGYADNVPDNRNKYLYHISVKQMMTKYHDETIQAVMKELKQMVDKDVFMPIRSAHMSVTERRKRIRSFMFMKEKFKSDGSFDKLKARLVAGGHMEEIPMMDISSPTASLEAVLMIAAIAAKERRHVVTADVPGAYLNADMVEQVIMIVEPLLAKILVEIQPDWKEFLDDKGALNVVLKKAMY